MLTLLFKLANLIEGEKVVIFEYDDGRRAILRENAAVLFENCMSREAYIELYGGEQCSVQA